MDDFEAIKQKFEAFAIDEAKAFDFIFSSDLESQHETYDKMHAHLEVGLHAHSGITKRRQKPSPLLLRLRGNEKEGGTNSARNIHKIAEYAHPVYHKVWVVYSSLMNFTLAESTIAAAFFIIEQENKLIIAQKYLYSNFTNDGFSFEWVVDDEQSNLTFESLGKLLGVKRYLEPQLSQFKELYWEEG